MGSPEIIWVGAWEQCDKHITALERGWQKVSVAALVESALPWTGGGVRAREIAERICRITWKTPQIFSSVAECAQHFQWKATLVALVTASVKAHETILTGIAQYPNVFGAVQIEKPFCANIDVAERMADLFTEKNIPLSVWEQILFSTVLAQARNVLWNVDIFNSIFKTAVSKDDIEIVSVESHWSKNRTQRTFGPSPNLSPPGCLHFEIPHQIALVIALLWDSHFAVGCASQQDWLMPPGDVGSTWLWRHPDFLREGSWQYLVNIPGHKSAKVEWKIGNTPVILTSHLCSKNRRITIVNLKNGMKLVLEMDPWSTRVGDMTEKIWGRLKLVLPDGTTCNTDFIPDNCLASSIQNTLESACWGRIISTPDRFFAVLRAIEMAQKFALNWSTHSV